MDFCVLVKISKRAISFWYQAGKNPYAPLIINETNIIPLCFYVNGNDFVFGNSAKSLFYSNDPNAYGNYFDIIKDPSKHFVFYGVKKPVKQLLYYGIEQYLSFFINTVLYKSDSIESYRQNFPLRFIFDTDIENKENTLITNIFSEAGYYNVESIDFQFALFETLQNQRIVSLNKNILLLTAIDNTLYLEIFNSSSWILLNKIKLEGHGADPRVKILAEMIIDYVAIQNPHLNLQQETEIAHILPEVVSLLDNNSPIIKGEIELVDGHRYWFTIKLRNLEERLLYANTDAQIYLTIDDLLRSMSINEDNVILLLGSEEISTPFFSTRLLKKYSSVFCLKNSVFIDTLKFIFSNIISNGYKSLPTASEPPPITNLNKSTPTANDNSQSKENTLPVPPLPKVKVLSPPLVPSLNTSKSDENVTTPIPPKIPPLKKDSGEKKDMGSAITPTIPKIPELDKVSEEKKKLSIPPLPPLPQKK